MLGWNIDHGCGNGFEVATFCYTKGILSTFRHVDGNRAEAAHGIAMGLMFPIFPHRWFGGCTWMLNISWS